MPPTGTAVIAATSAVPDDQAGMFDREVTDLQLFKAIAEWHEQRDAHKAFLAANKTIREAVKLVELKDGDRVRVSDGDGQNAVLVGKHRAGGGFEIPEWESVGVGSIQLLD